MSKLNYRKIVSMFLILFVVTSYYNFSYAKKVLGSQEVEAPTNDEVKINKSEDTLYNSGGTRYDPIHTGRAGFVKEEYDKVDNFDVNFDTLELRIKYFAPNYQKKRQDVITNDIINNGMRGKDTTNYTSNYLDIKNSTILTDKEREMMQIKMQVLAYLSLKNNFDAISGMKELQEKIVVLSKDKYNLGLLTALDYNTSIVNLSDTETQYSELKASLDSMLSNVALLLGYDVKDKEKLNFVEPSIDLGIIEKIDYATDFDKMLKRDSNYNTILTTGDEGSNGSNKLPDSTGKEIYEKKLKSAYDTVVANYELKNATLKNSYKLYISSRDYLSKIIEAEEVENEKKYKAAMIDEIEYLQNKIKIISDKAKVEKSKYDLINTYTDYYYATLLYSMG